MPYKNGKVKEYKNTTQKRGTSPRPKLRPKYMNQGVGGTIDVSPSAEAGDQFFVQEAMRRREKAKMSKK